ncbi:LamG-like jellyroll fold domain-containing protein [Cellulomonas sp. PhB143]|uniref:LamG-like jellyroll fold domain-containing protein n=1 Tax=Cellulomonas sp. PhB143 TaxID=2485186 RepID=UPI000FA4D969|nr:LamG-like jellyroll fold domain-containing protein [Cellulomonas sp. PhB143]ROS72128.1 glycosyl hydrolase family 2 [Cellulomonas sp. PhB143]
MKPARPRLIPLLLAPLTALALVAGGGLPATAAQPAAAAQPASAHPTAAQPAAAPADDDDPNAEPHGLKGEYFRMSAPGARDFADLGGTTLDPEINGSGLVSNFERLTGQTDDVTVRWTGQITAPETGDYTFYAIGDNGFRLFVDGKAVIDHWEPDWDKEQTSKPVHLEAGERHDLRLEYFQDGGGASMTLRWSSATVARQVVPESAYTPPADYPVYPVAASLPADGQSVRLTFTDEVAGLEDLAKHLSVEADTIAMPVGAVTPAPGAPDAVVVALDEPVQKSAKVQVAYDGEGSLTVGGEPTPQLIRTATNRSTHRLLTSWGEKLDKDHPLPEYPRPQKVRDRWQNLNGQWQFAAAAAGEQPTFGKSLDERITVPFPVESQLSGIERHEDHMFYRTLVDVPKDWKVGDDADGERLVLNFGAVDNEATVWVNGELVAKHTGGYDAFSADITDALVDDAQQEIVVAVTDTTGVDQTRGKQSPNPSGIFYTASSGIWQTVWMEPVAKASIDDLVTTPDVADGSLTLKATSAGASPAATVTAVATDADGAEVGRVTGPVGEDLRLPVPDPRLWSPDDPYLYDLAVTLDDGTGAGATTDDVTSYFGMRTVGIQKVGGVQKLVLNGKPIFSLAMLDQGFWPDGLYTAPSDDAMAFDIKAQKDLGFNAIRKHIKVEPARWYYHADQMGMLVWQDFVPGDYTGDAGRQEFMDEGLETVRELHDSPSVIGWILFNEGFGEWDRAATGRFADQVKAADPSRVVNAHSGVNCCSSKGDSGKGDILDHHDYMNTEPSFPDATRAAMDGEHGGFTLPTPGHLWPGAPAAVYSGVPDKAAFTAKYVQNTEQFYLDRARGDLSGSVYTQVTDLENEINGFYTYDRKVLKVDAAQVRDVNERVIAAGAAAGAAPAGSGRWSLDEGTGTTAADASGTSPLALRDGAGWGEGVHGTGLTFDGDGGSADSAGPVVDTTGDYTVSAWVTLGSLPSNYATAVSQDGSQTENPFYLQYGQGAFAFSTPGGKRATLRTTPKLDTWYHLVGVHDAAAGKVRLFVDGVQAGEAAAAQPVASFGAFSVGRGAFNHQRGDFWDGSIDEVQVFDRALSAAEIAQLHDGDQPGALDVTATAVGRCVGTSPYVAVRAVNGEDVPLDVTIATVAGTRTYDDVAPGKAASLSVKVRGAMADGVATVTARPSDASDARDATVEAEYEAVSCG